MPGYADGVTVREFIANPGRLLASLSIESPTKSFCHPFQLSPPDIAQPLAHALDFPPQLRQLLGVHDITYDSIGP